MKNHWLPVAHDREWLESLTVSKRQTANVLFTNGESLVQKSQDIESFLDNFLDR